MANGTAKGIAIVSKLTYRQVVGIRSRITRLAKSKEHAAERLALYQRLLDHDTRRESTILKYIDEARRKKTKAGKRKGRRLMEDLRWMRRAQWFIAFSKLGGDDNVEL